MLGYYRNKHILTLRPINSDSRETIPTSCCIYKQGAGTCQELITAIIKEHGLG